MYRVLVTISKVKSFSTYNINVICIYNNNNILNHIIRKNNRNRCNIKIILKISM